MNQINEGDKVFIRGFVDDYCHGKMPPPSSWQYEVYMAEIDREPCVIRRRANGENQLVYIPSRQESWFVRKEFIKPYSGLESEAVEL